MKSSNKKLIAELSLIISSTTDTVLQLQKMDAEILSYKMNRDAWSALECLQHLNLYGDFYLPEIEKQLLAAEKKNEPMHFKSGMIGNYFANLMNINNGKMKKMKSPADKDPSHSEVSLIVIDRFLKQQHLLLTLLLQAECTDLTKTKTRISLTKLLRLRLGDTLRFFVYHIERHVQQAKNAATNAADQQQQLKQVA